MFDVGMAILEGQVHMDPATVAPIKTWAQPKNLRNVCVFIGFANFYQRFIKDFVTIMQPLHDLSKKDAPWQWTWVEKKALQMLKDTFVSKLMLAMWNPARLTCLETNTSAHTISGMILQLCNNRLYHPIIFQSKLQTSAERNSAHSVNIGHVRQLTQGVGSTLWYALRKVYLSFLYGSRMIPLCI
jgi:hypothetical protein